LSHDADRCFIHIDAKAPLGRFAAAAGETAELIEPRISVYWGDFSLIEAAHALMSAAIGWRWQFDRFVLLSGVDYPLQPAAYIHDHFRRHANSEFINAVRIPCEAAGKPWSRIEGFRCRSADSPWKKAQFRLKVRLGLRSAMRPYAQVLGDLVPFGGSAWWALSRGAVEHVLRFFVERPEVIAFYENVHFPDESLFQTIIMNSPFAATVRRNLTYTDWTEGGSRPSLLGARHVDLFERQPQVIVDGVYGSGEVLFARKFSDADASLVDRLDEVIARRGRC
jgi:hypothetical protein